MHAYCKTFKGGRCEITGYFVSKRFCEVRCKGKLPRKADKNRKARSSEDKDSVLSICKECSRFKKSRDSLRCNIGCCGGRDLSIMLKWEDLSCPENKW